MHPSSQIRAVIFDIGGVLVRTEDQTPRVLLAQQYGLSLEALYRLVFDSPIANLATLGEEPEERVWMYVAEQLHLSAEAKADFQVRWWAGDRFDFDLFTWLQSLRPNIQLGLLSNAWSNARHDLERKFGCVSGFDVSVFSAEVKQAKPVAGIYTLILERLGVRPEEAVFVDDAPQNITAAQALGLRAVRFENAQQARRDVTQWLNV